MIPLAVAIEGKLIFFVVAAVVGVINWWLEKKKKESQANTPPQSAPPNKPMAEGGNNSEQERLRRFLEALGVPPPPQTPPQTQPRPQPQRAPQPSRPKPAQGGLPHPVQRQVTQRIEGRMQGTKPLRKPQQPVTQRAKPVVPQPEEMQRAGRIEEAASSIERISGEFREMNVRVAMPPMQTPDRPAHLTGANAGTTSVLERGGNPLVASLRRTLTNPTGIRAAFLAAELLGPPKGLQR